MPSLPLEDRQAGKKQHLSQICVGMETMKFVHAKQVRFHSILDGSSLAHAIQVLMGPLLMNYGRMRCTEMKRLLGTELDTHTVGKNPPGSRTIVRVQAETER